MDTTKRLDRNAALRVIRLQSKKEEPVDLAINEPDCITCGDAQARLFVSDRPLRDWIVELGYLLPQKDGETTHQFSYSIPIHAVAHAALVLAKPVRGVQILTHVKLEDPIPDFKHLSQISRDSWILEQRPVAIYTATKHTRNFVGGVSRMKVYLHTVSHSLGVSAIYLASRSLWPDLIKGWVGEHECKPTEFREAQPDAYLAGEDKQKLLALEFAADYPAERFKRLDYTLREKRIPYIVFGAAT